MSVTNNTITNYKTVTNSKLTISCFVFHLKNAHIPLVSRTILVERMSVVKNKSSVATLLWEKNTHFENENFKVRNMGRI